MTTQPPNIPEESDFENILRVQKQAEEEYQEDIKRKIREVLGEGFEVGQSVSIRRKNGQIESDWKLKQVYLDKIMATKTEEDGVLMSFFANLNEFLILNGRAPNKIGKIEDGSQKEENHNFYEVKRGDNILGIIKNKLIEASLISGQEEPLRMLYIVGNIANKIKKMGAGELQEVGITSGIIDILYPGDIIDFEKFLDIGGGIGVVKHIIEDSENLSAGYLSALQKAM
ncbi:MAG: hypothetical protein AAB840_02135, partial [Patescibacteria group bacterium]